jgi:hypothetical protein
MNKRVLWSVVALVALAAAVYFARSPKTFRAPAAGNPKNEIAIQDGKTIDFSSGKPVVKDTAKEKAIMASALKEMSAAAKDVTFTPPPTEEKKSAETKK